jgi:hypothetical protein
MLMTTSSWRRSTTPQKTELGEPGAKWIRPGKRECFNGTLSIKASRQRSIARLARKELRPSERPSRRRLANADRAQLLRKVHNILSVAAPPVLANGLAKSELDSRYWWTPDYSTARATLKARRCRQCPWPT